MKWIHFFLTAVCLLGVLVSCRPQGAHGTMLSGADQKAVLAFSEAKIDNLLEGLNTGDYAVFSKDFDEHMLQAMTRDEFEPWQKERATRLGRYLRREVEGMVARSDGTYTVIYQTSFQFHDDVLMRVVFAAKPPHQISELWFEK